MDIQTQGAPSPRKTAAFILQTLREDMRSIPTFATPKHPLPAFMKTEQQIEVLMNALQEVSLTLEDIGTDAAELEQLLEQAVVFRARYLLRMVRHGKEVCEKGRELRALGEEHPYILAKVRVPDAVHSRIDCACAC